MGKWAPWIKHDVMTTYLYNKEEVVVTFFVTKINVVPIITPCFKAKIVCVPRIKFPHIRSELQ
jgi:hypothetical protein